jgi:hypothetical protein
LNVWNHYVFFARISGIAWWSSDFDYNFVESESGIYDDGELRF